MRLNPYCFFVIINIACAINANAQVPSYVPLSGLEAWYPLDNNAVDSSGNGNNGTVSGATLVPDRFGHPNCAYSFNGINNYIYIPSSTSLNITGSVTLAAWVKSRYLGGGQYQIIFRGDTRSAYDPYMLMASGSFIVFRRNVGSGTAISQAIFPISIIDTTAFHLLVGTFESSNDTMKIYYDAVLQQSVYQPGTIGYYTDSAHNMIGAVDYGTWQYFTGTIDDVGIWARALSQCEITALYNGTGVYSVAAITGITTICTGSTTTLSDTTTGGTWSSSNTAVATVGSTTGIVTGVSAGTAIITYTAPITCGTSYVTTTVTVNPSPAAITGITTVAVGSTTTLHDATTGGVWTSSNPLMATVGSSSGIVTGVAAGSVIITYTVGGCYVTTYLPVTSLCAPIIVTFAGTTVGFAGDGGPATAAKLNFSWGVGTDAAGNVYTSDFSNNRVRKIAPSGIITTFAGNGTGGFGGDGGPATAANLTPTGVRAFGTNVYIADVYNSRIRKVDASGTITTFAGNGVSGHSGDGGPATAASISSPNSLGVDNLGNVYIPDQSTNYVRIVSPAGIINTIAGSGIAGYSGDGGPATLARMNLPNGVAVDGSGNVYVSEYNNNVIRKINTAGIISTYAGTGVSGYSGDGGPASAAKISGPAGIYVDATGNLYITDANNYRLRKVDPTGVITTIAGIGTSGLSGDGGPATAAKINRLNDVGGDVYGNIYIADASNNRVREIIYRDLPPHFINGHNQYVSACAGIVADSINSLLAVMDTDLAQSETWSVVAAPLHGTLVASYSAISTGSTVTPYGLYYAPTTGYVGTDSFKVCVTDCGGLSDTTTIHITINPLPTVYPVYIGVLGVDTLCAISTGSHIFLGYSSPGITYQLFFGGVIMGLPLFGTGSALDFGAYTLPGIYTVLATNPITGCVNIMGAAVILPPVGPITGLSTVCAGGTITLADTSLGGTWSATNGHATVGATTGIVTGVSVGIDTIIYTVSAGCTAMKVVTVNAASSVITGTPTMCLGSTTTLSGGCVGGVWSSSSTIVATVGSSSGIVTGISVGACNITCGCLGGCFAFVTVTVNPFPTPIFGPLTVCVGGTAAFSSTPTGGVWSMSNGYATIGSSSGIVTGITAGVDTIIYTLPTGCAATKVITVNLSGSITGIMTVCAGATTSLLSGCSGGTWSSGATAIATIGSGTGIVTGVSAGTCTITCICPGGCTSTATVTVNPLPALFTLTGGGSYCAGGTGLHIVLGGSTTGVSYQLYDGTTPVGLPLTGAGSAIDFGLQTFAGTYTVVATTTTGCSRTMTGSVTITINPLPSSISGPSSLCVGATITETDAGGGTWGCSMPAIASIGSTGVVTGIAIGTATITYTLPTGCFATKVITVSLSPTAITGASTLCASDSTTLTDTVGGGVWTSSVTTVATVGSLSGVVTGVGAGVVTITYSLGTGCTRTKAMTINASPAVITGSMGMCVGHTTALSCATPGGTWTSGATAIATIGSTGTVSGISAGMAGITYTLATGCKSTARVTVNALPPAITGTMHVCTGATTTLGDITGGGIWTSSLPTTASIGSGTGIVSGIVTGTVTITYSLGSGCTVTTPVTVYPSPAVIGGASMVCIGATTTVTDITGGGTWSCPATAIATIGTGTGIVTGVSAGVATISYTVANGCMATKAMTVNAPPGPIMGGTTLCVGTTATLTDTSLCATWSSSATAIAVIGSGTGIITGVSPGVVTFVCYCPITGCSTSTTGTVNAMPPAITGTPTVCVGSTTTLSDAIPGGVWSSGTPGIALVNPSSGVVTGIAAGTVNITDLLPGGCTVTKMVTVNALPASITGLASTCIGATTLLTDATPGGTWSSSNTTIAAVGTSTGIVTGVNYGVATITYLATTGCKTTLQVTVNVPPSSVMGSSNVCQGLTITLTDATPGGTWSSSNTSIATITSTGVVTGVSNGSVTISYTVATGCTATRVVVVTHVPPITGLHNICAWGDTVTVHDSVTTGLYTSTLATAINLGGGTALVTAYAPGAATVTYTLPSGCYTTATLTVYPIPGLITGTNIIHVGSTTTLHNVVTGGTWSSGAPTIATVVPGTGLVTGVGAGSAHITYTLPTGCYADTTVHVTAARPGAEQTTAEEPEGAITVIPNPNKGAFTIKGTLSLATNEDVWLEITDMLGQVVYKNKVVAENGKLETDILLNDIANGMYLLSVQSNTEKKVMHVVVSR